VVVGARESLAICEAIQRGKHRDRATAPPGEHLRRRRHGGRVTKRALSGRLTRSESTVPSRLTCTWWVRRVGAQLFRGTEVSLGAGPPWTSPPSLAVLDAHQRRTSKG
jgi:hypothetical protein